MWYLINSWKLLSENPQPPPPEKTHSPIFTHSPLKIQKIQKFKMQAPPLFANIENFSGLHPLPPPPPLQKGETLYHLPS